MERSEELRALPVDEVVRRVGVAQAIGIKYVASLLFTYRCTIACRHCLFNCSPKRPDVCVTIEDGVEFMRQLRQTDRVIHIAGGEAMMYYGQMLEICRLAHQEGAAPHFFETNASWCVDDATAQTRYEALRDAGVQGVLISADPYHQAFVPPERRLRAFQWAVAIYGRENVVARELSLTQLGELREISRDPERLADYTRHHSPRLVGRAGDDLAEYYPARPLDDLANDPLWHGGAAGRSCRSEFDVDQMWEIHVDPYGNIQTCCGIIVGNIRERPLIEQMREGFHVHNPLVRAVYEDGPYAYLKMAQERGYAPRDGYPQKCFLCWETRKFLRPYFPETFGPAEIYEAV